MSTIECVTEPVAAPARRLAAAANVAMAALCMVATLPGRTHGLGLVTEPLLADLGLSRTAYGTVNMAATLLGALFCIPAGRLIDRYGNRAVAAVTMLALGLTVVGMSWIGSSLAVLLVMVTLTRGFGQSALSVVSVTIVGKWFTRRSGAAMGVYSALLTVGFVAAFPLVGAVVQSHGWRWAWAMVGCGVLVSAGLGFMLISDPRPGRGPVAGAAEQGLTLGEAVREPAFWVFAGGISLYGLAVSGIGLFNQSVLKELGFEAGVYYTMMSISTGASLLGQGACAAAISRLPMRRVVSVCMMIYAVTLFTLPLVRTQGQLFVNAAGMGCVGGAVMLLFYAIWSQVFGRRQLGRIQGAAQMMTVVASALGPLALAQVFERTGSYNPAFYALALGVGVIAVAAWYVRMPRTGAAAAVHTEQ